ncbi:MAG: RNA-binding protein [Geminicoccaceae bacterium]|nr:MAG: RNA-binding protein [Geminicoccaceae bacterium]
MSRKLFVANFPYSTGEESLRDLFGQYGEVEEIKIIYDRETGRSRGFGFVMMENEGHCVTAAEALNGAELGGRNIAVRVAEPRPNAANNDRGRDNEGRQGPKRFALARPRARRARDGE